MPELGNKHTCADCETKYYDLGRPDASCPKCGSANRLADDEAATPPSRAPRARPKPKAAAAVKDSADGDDGDASDDTEEELELDVDDAEVEPDDEE